MEKFEEIQVDYQRAEIFFIGALTVFLINLELTKFNFKSQALEITLSILNTIGYIGAALMLISGATIMIKREREGRN